MTAKQDFLGLLNTYGSTVQFHRVDSLVPCPCQTPEGFRDPEWHDAHPTDPVCNEEGMLADPSATVDINVKAFIQPSQTTRSTRMSAEYIEAMFGEIQAGDHIGIFPETWMGKSLEFYDWSQAGEDWVKYNGRYYTVVAANLIPEPDTGVPRGHWECGLRLIGEPLG